MVKWKEEIKKNPHICNVKNFFLAIWRPHESHTEFWHILYTWELVGRLTFSAELATFIRSTATRRGPNLEGQFFQMIRISTDFLNENLYYFFLLHTNWQLSILRTMAQHTITIYSYEFTQNTVMFRLGCVRVSIRLTCEGGADFQSSWQRRANSWFCERISIEKFIT
jgi:hypothetical protein